MLQTILILLRLHRSVLLSSTGKTATESWKFQEILKHLPGQPKMVHRTTQTHYLDPGQNPPRHDHSLWVFMLLWRKWMARALKTVTSRFQDLPRTLTPWIAQMTIWERLSQIHRPLVHQYDGSLHHLKTHLLWQARESVHLFLTMVRCYVWLKETFNWLVMSVATLQLSPVKNRATGKPIMVDSSQHMQSTSLTTLPSG